MRRALVAAVLLTACGSDKDPGDSGLETPAACEAGSLTLGQDLGRAELVAAEDPVPWSDRPSVIGPGIALADLDGDGWLDLAVASSVGLGAILLNDGTGQLVSSSWSPLPTAQSIAAGDVDDDGILDLFLGTEEGRSDLILRSDGQGGFTESELPESLGHTTTGAFADPDGDGDLDLMVTRYVVWPDYEEVQAGTIEGGGNVLYAGDGTGAFVATSAIPAQHLDDLSHQAQWLDANDDQHLDLYLSNDFGMFLDPNQLLLGDGTGAFSLAEQDCGCQLGMEAMGVAVGDLDGLGTPDLFITDIGGSEVLINDGQASFYEAAKASGAHIPLSADRMVAWGTVAADLDRDGDADLPMVYGALAFWDPELVAHFWDEEGNEWLDTMSQQDALLESDGSGQFTEAAAAWGFGDSAIGRALVAGDLDRDGRIDLVSAGFDAVDEPFVRTWRGQGGCGTGVTVVLDEALTGTWARLALPDGRETHAWLAPSTTFSSQPAELVLGLAGFSSGTLTLVAPGGDTETIEVADGDQITRR